MCIAVIDYGMGNIGSVLNMLRKIKGDPTALKEPSLLANYSHAILSGVGAFDNAISELNERGWSDALNKHVVEKGRPVLGICLGMQLMCKSSEEGNLPGFGWLNAEVRRFNFDDDFLKIPHMGWNTITTKNKNPLIPETTDKQRFYFVHSYYIICNNPDNIIAVSNHGHNFVCAFQQNNIFGVQFHPEKSHRFGMELLKNFLRL